MVSFTFLAVISGLTSSVYGASLQRVQNFGNNPTGAEMHIYVPDRRTTNPPILVAAHYCGGSAQAYYSGTQYARLADTHGFIVIYPDAPDSGNCWDVHSTQTLTHNGGGDSLAVANMVKYALQQYSGDANRVFSTGTSSGAMLSQVLAGSYPDIFKGISAFAGVPFGCFAGSGMWNSQCAQGQSIKTGQQWGDMVRAAYPGYTGSRPKIQLWHGTNDETLNFNNHGEAVKQWTNVLGVSETPTQTENNSPLSGWTRRHYGPNMQAITAQGVPHNIPVQAAEVIKFFGLDQAAPVNPQPTVTPGNPQPTPTPTPQPTPTPPTTGPLVPKWQQCGGMNHQGGTQCVEGSTCVKINDWYSQCQ